MRGRERGMGLEEKTSNEEGDSHQCQHDHLIFTYGTLKHGFSNHCLIQDLIPTGDAFYLGVRQTVTKYPLVCGPFQVPFLLNFPGLGHRVIGELYSVSQLGLARMDELEGITQGHYERLPIKVKVVGEEDNNGKEVEAYFGHISFAEEMWRRNGEKGFSEYTQEMAKGYVKRKDRPKDISFIDHIRLFISSSDH